MSRPSRVPRGVLLVTTATFVALALAALVMDNIAADATIRESVLAASTPSLVSVMRVVNLAGNWRILLPATLLLLVAFDRARRTWWLWLALMVAAPLVEGALKVVVGRPRPEGSAYGFPSGHATAIAAYAGAVLYLAAELPSRWRTTVRALAIALMLAVGAARIILRAHWPSDVLGGFALGLALASAAALLATAKAPIARRS